MKIAVLFYGRIDKCKNNYENIKNNLINNDVDIYLSCDDGSIDDLNDFIRLYKPVNYCNNKKSSDLSIYDKYSANGNVVNINKMIPCLINKKKVFELMKSSNIIYDIIISTRIDIFYNEKIYLDNFNLINSSLYIPCNCDYGTNSINDQIAIGNFNNMEKYMKIYDNIISYLENGTSKHPESLTFANINFHKINVERFNLSYIIIR